MSPGTTYVSILLEVVKSLRERGQCYAYTCIACPVVLSHYLRIGFPNGLFSSISLPNIMYFCSPHTSTTWPTDIILLDLIVRMIFVEEHK